MVNVPLGITDLTQNLTQDLFELANAQRHDTSQREAAMREDANQREVAAVQGEQKIRQENAIRGQKIREENAEIRDDNAKRDQLAFQREKLQTETEPQTQKF